MSAMTGIPSPLWAENQRLQAVVADLRARVAELEAQLAAVPVDAIRLAHFGDVYTPGYMDACSVVGDWLIELAYAGTAQDVTA